MNKSVIFGILKALTSLKTIPTHPTEQKAQAQSRQTGNAPASAPDAPPTGTGTEAPPKKTGGSGAYALEEMLRRQEMISAKARKS